MCKILLFCGLLAGVFGTANAQKARFGAKAGIGFASLTNANTVGGEYMPVPQAGVMGDFGLNERVYFHPELLFSQKGMKTVTRPGISLFGGAGGVGTNSRTLLTYLDLPLLFRLKSKGLFLEAGPQAGFLVALKGEDYVNNVLVYSTNSTANARRVDLGYIVGVGYQLPQGLELGFRYNGGIFDVNTTPTPDAKQRNSVFQLQLGYLFGGK